MLTFQLEGSDERVAFSDAALSTFRAHRQTGPNAEEGGGQLFARFEDRIVIVFHVTEPAASDVRSPFRFVADRFRERRHIRRLHARGLHYVGDWHTHPQVIPEPSKVDIVSIGDCYRKSLKEISGFLLVIVGTAEFPAGLFVGLTDGVNFRVLRN